MTSEVLLAAAQTTAQPTTITWYALGAVVLGIIMTVSSIYMSGMRKNKSKTPYVGLLIVVVAAIVAIYSTKQ